MRIYEHFTEQELTILRTRAERIASLVQAEVLEETAAALLVSVHGERYGLPMEAISAVYEDVKITPVPNVPAFALGIANIRGRVVFVLDLGMLLGVPSSAAIESKLPVIVLESELGVAFQVDAIEGIERFAMDRLTKDLPNLDLIKKSFLLGLSPDGKALLNVKSILDDLVAIANSATK